MQIAIGLDLFQLGLKMSLIWLFLGMTIYLSYFINCVVENIINQFSLTRGKMHVTENSKTIKGSLNLVVGAHYYHCKNMFFQMFF